MASKARRLSATQVSYTFSPATEPKYHVESGDTLIVETPDCFGGVIESEQDTHDVLDLERVNGAVGPIYIEGANPGDCLKVKIRSVRVTGGTGVMMTIPGFGLLRESLKIGKTKICRISKNRIVFKDGVKVPLSPMIGTIGVAPELETVSTITPGAHGGNLDTRDVKAGSSVYFPVFVKGALLGLGDCHAAMGDGEVCVTGVEVPAQVTLKVDVIHGFKLLRPIIETEDEWMTLGSAATLEEAARLATQDMLDIVKRKLGMGDEEAYMLLSAAGDLRISQVVNPYTTVRMAVSKNHLKSII
ncbi:acetamidase/formamidase family protein [Candidatus Bathyarchaeota archaeon]|nr:acetamidase/formamidase family protein [Candidatus Bathyarchaeota archaeon]